MVARRGVDRVQFEPRRRRHFQPVPTPFRSGWRRRTPRALRSCDCGAGLGPRHAPPAVHQGERDAPATRFVDAVADGRSPAVRLLGYQAQRTGGGSRQMAAGSRTCQTSLDAIRFTCGRFLSGRRVVDLTRRPVARNGARTAWNSFPRTRRRDDGGGASGSSTARSSTATVPQPLFLSFATALG